LTVLKSLQQNQNKEGTFLGSFFALIL